MLNQGSHTSRKNWKNTGNFISRAPGWEMPLKIEKITKTRRNP
jgi:hypothetical protein